MIIIRIFICLILFFGFNSFISFAQPEFISIKINEVTMQVEIAKDAISRRSGLKFRQILPQDSGMLFIFEIPGRYGFYMKDTLVDLDIAFIDKDYNIIQICPLAKGVEKTVYPRDKILYALEANRGFFSQHKIIEGDKLEILDRG